MANNRQSFLSENQGTLHEFSMNIKSNEDIYNNPTSPKSFLHKTFVRRLIYLVLGVVFWAALITPIFIAYKNNGIESSSPVEVSEGKYTSDNRIDIIMNLIDIDLNTRKGTFFVQLKPLGIYKQKNNSLSSKISAHWEFENKVFEKNELLTSFTMTIPFITGTITDYPFDKFFTSMPTTLKNEKGDSVPKKITVLGFSQSFRLTVDYKRNKFKHEDEDKDNQEEKTMELVLKVERTWTTKAISIFITILMWSLSISISNIGYDVVFLNREIIPGLMSVGVSMMFALPALRNTQPGIPSTSCLSDILGYFWNMIIICTSAIAIIYTWALRYN